MSVRRVSMRSLLTLEAFDRSADGGGGATGAWRRVGLLWGEVRAVSAIEREAAGGAFATVSHRATVPASPAAADDRPAPGMRLRERERTFAVRAVTAADPRARRLSLWLSEECGA